MTPARLGAPGRSPARSDDALAPASDAEPGLELARIRALYELTAAVAAGQEPAAVQEVALCALERLLDARRSAILLFDDGGVMRFAAWHGLSDVYRAAVEGHSPWERGACDPTPVVVADAASDPSLAAYQPLFAAEGIAALLFVPICFGGALLGKFMVYFDAPRQVAPDELAFAQTVARHVAVAADRARSAEDLRRSRDDLGAILDGVADAITVQDAAGRLVFANQAGARQLGFDSPGELLATPLDELMRRYTLLDEEGGPFPAERLPGRVALVEGRAGEALVRFRFAATGEERWSQVKATPVRDAGGKVRFAVNVFRDVTEERRAEAAALFLADASAVLAASLDHETTLRSVARLAVPRVADWCAIELVRGDGPATEQVAVAHADAGKVELAQALRRRYPPDPAAPRGVHQVIRSGEPELYPEVPDPLLTASAQDAEHLAVLRALELRSAMVVPLRARGRTLGAITFISCQPHRRYGPADLVMAQDLASRAALAIDNARLYGEVRRADERKSEFLAMLAHELRNPLAPIVTATHLLRLRGGEPAAGRVLEVVDRQVGHMTRIVDDLLDVSRLTRGRFELRREPLDLGALVRATAEDHRPLAEARGLALEVRVEPAPLPARGDATRLAQVIGNLLANAFKFTDRGGAVTVRVAREGREAVVAVRDTGIGMAPELVVDLFEPFVQADRSLARSRGGLGLGLAVARGIVAMHQGRIEAESPGPGRGAEVRFRLPLAAALAGAADAPASAPAARARRVLVIEDHADAAEMLQALLEHEGHEVAVAASGPEGLEVAERFQPEVVLCDLGLPGLDGFEVAVRLREARGPGLPLVALSGYAQEDDRARARAAGFDVHLTKPVSAADLARALGALVG
ncbi:MAG: GAF domain-containing protein [Planctomycetes bacterium]|nr:GAF domain-containing protein [Planctomycetota bacterium]